MSQFRGTKCLRGRKIHSLVSFEPQTYKYMFYLYWLVWLIHMHASLPNWNNILEICLLWEDEDDVKHCTLRSQSEPFLYDKKSSPNIWEKCFSKHLLAHALKCFSGLEHWREILRAIHWFHPLFHWAHRGVFSPSWHMEKLEHHS